MFIVFSAWRDSTYIPLAEILLRLGSRGLDLEWSCDIEEATPGQPHDLELETQSTHEWISTLRLLALVTPNTQILDGRVDGTVRATGDALLSIQAQHSARWRIESSDPEILELFATAYPPIQRYSTYYRRTDSVARSASEWQAREESAVDETTTQPTPR
ncbi:hypothetical protein [Embleya sp. NPDC001921]